MRLWVLSGKVLLVFGSLAIGLTVYVLSPSARAVGFGYWVAIVVYIGAAELAWYLTELQSSRRPRLLSEAGLRAVSRHDYRVSDSFTGAVAAISEPFCEIAADNDVERDLQSSLLNALTQAGSANRFELIVGPPGAGKTTLLYRLGWELLTRGYAVCMLSTRMPPTGVSPEALRTLAKDAHRFFILIDDIELQPAVGSLLETVLDGEDAITVVGTCSRQAYNAMLRGSGAGSVAPRDLVSLGSLHQLRLTAREAQALHDKLAHQASSRPELAILQRQVSAAGITDILTLTISLRHALHPTAFARSALEALTEADRNLLCGVCIASLAGRPLSCDDLAAVLEPDFASCSQAIVGAGLAVIRGGKLYGPHPAIALILLRTPDLARDVDLLELAAGLIPSLFERDRPLADAVMRAVVYSLDSEFSTRLWTRCGDTWVSAADQLAPAEVLEALVPTLRLGGDHKLAAELCRHYLAHEQLADRASFQLALCLYHLSAYSASGEIFERFLDRKPYTTTACINCALTDIGQGRYQEAEDRLQALQQTGARIPGLHHLLGYLAELQGQSETAMERYEEARAQYWHDNAALRKLATLKMLTGSTREAIRLYEAGLQQDPDHVEYYGGLAVAHHMAGDTRRAMVQSARATQAGIEPALARKAVARAYMDHGLYEQALVELNNCLIYMPEDSDAQVLVARCLRAQDDLAGARAALEAAVALEPQLLTAKQELAVCLRDLQDHDAAAALVDQLLSSHMPTSDLYLLAASIAALQGDDQLQAQRAALALEAGDESGWAWFISAQALGGQQAAESYQRAVNLLAQTAVTGTRVESAAAYQAIAVCRQNLGDQAAAEQAAGRAAKSIGSDRYRGEPIFSALLFRSVPGAEFLQQLRQFGLPDPEQS